MITELLKLKLLQTTKDADFITAADTFINGFWRTQDGFIDAELIKDPGKNDWYFIYHFESMEKMKTSGDKMRASEEFGQLISLIVQDSVTVTFTQQLRKWI